MAATATILVPPTLAAFTGVTANPGNAWATGEWDPPGAATFSYTGSAQSFVVPTGYSTVTIETWGAQGGGAGGLGATRRRTCP